MMMKTKTTRTMKTMMKTMTTTMTRVVFVRASTRSAIADDYFHFEVAIDDEFAVAVLLSFDFADIDAVE